MRDIGFEADDAVQSVELVTGKEASDKTARIADGGCGASDLSPCGIVDVGESPSGGVDFGLTDVVETGSGRGTQKSVAFADVMAGEAPSVEALLIAEIR